MFEVVYSKGDYQNKIWNSLVLIIPLRYVKKNNNIVKSNVFVKWAFEKNKTFNKILFCIKRKQNIFILVQYIFRESKRTKIPNTRINPG